MRAFCWTILSMLLGLSVPLNITAQELVDPANYYPLQTGNVWQFSSKPQAIWPDSIIITAEVLGDTTMSNGHTYKVIQGAEALAVDAVYQRIDTAKALIYAYDAHERVERAALWLSLDQSVHHPDSGESGWIRRFNTLEQHPIFGQRYWTLIKFNQASQSPDWTIWLGEGIGTVDKDLYGGAPLVWDVRQLLFARVNGREYGTLVSTAIDDPLSLSDGLVLEMNYPNPFTSYTYIPFRMRTRSQIQLVIYDLLGREVAVLVNGERSAGLHVVEWRSDDFASGPYLCRLIVHGESLIRVLIKTE